MQLFRPDGLPDAFLSCSPEDLFDLLGEPTLVHLEGRREPPLFLTILQHGNEPVGFHAVQIILRKYEGRQLPRSIWLFIGNVAAAAEGKRLLDGGQDFNRIWPGTDRPESPESLMMQEVRDIVTQQPLFLSIDLHNNSGKNPHYGCINRLDPEFLQLAALFARTAVYFRQPPGVQSLAMAGHCPAITVECGKSGDETGVDHAVEFIDSCLHLDHLPDHPPAPGDLTLLRTHAAVKVRPETDFGFGNETGPLIFREDLDRHNFGLLKSGEALAHTQPADELPLTATLDDGRDIASELFTVSGDRLVARRDIIPSMATTDAAIVRQDCLFYVMEEMPAI